MQHTDKYKFNIIDPSDDFSPDALNDNAKKLETALLEHKSETDAALSQQKSETNAALAAHESTMNTRVVAVETAVDAGARFVKLGDGTDGTAGQTITFDLSKVDMNDYAALLLFGSAYGADSTSTLATTLSVNSKEMVRNLMVTPAKTPVTGLTVLQPVGSYVMALTWYGVCIGDGLSSASTTGSTFFTSRITQSWLGITKLAVACGPTVISANMALYGVKK